MDSLVFGARATTRMFAAETGIEVFSELLGHPDDHPFVQEEFSSTLMRC